MLEKNKTPIRDHGLEILTVSLLSPIVLGIITGVLFNDFTAGAGAGGFIIIGAWVLLGIAVFVEM